MLYKPELCTIKIYIKKMLKIVIVAPCRNSTTQSTLINSIDFDSQFLKGTLGRICLKNATKVDFVMTRRDCNSLRTFNSQTIPLISRAQIARITIQ